MKRVEVQQRRLTPEIVARLVALVRADASVEEAGYVVGARPTTLRRWLSEDPLLRAQISEAQEEAEARRGRKAADRVFSDEAREHYLELLALGNGRKVAANLCGLEENALRWLMRADEEFEREVEHAEAEAEAFFVGQLRADAEQSSVGRRWVSSVEWLKRRRASDWGDIQRLEVVQQLELLKKAHEELASEGIDIPLDQMITDFKAMDGATRKVGRPRKQTALPPGQ